MIKITPRIWRRHRYRWYSQQTTTDRYAKLLQLFLILVALVLANSLAMVIFEDLTFWDALWLTMTTMTTVGYGDLSAQTVYGQVATIAFMYVFGIFLLAQIAGEWIDFRIDRKEKMKKGLWRWEMKDHIVIINTPEQDGERYLQILVEQIRNTTSLQEFPIQIFSPRFPGGLPNELSGLGVVLHHGYPEGRSNLGEADIESAAFILVLAVDANDFRSDSITLDILDQLKATNVRGHVVAECLQDENRERLKQHGADAVIRPVRAYPELMVRAMAAPGTETILEDLFRYQGSHPHRYDISIDDQRWGDLATRMLNGGCGTPIGFLGDDDRIVTNPPADRRVNGKALFVMVNHEQVPDEQQIRDALTPTTS
ncbi:MAG: two pore domain potassium channel family protein [Pseudomonadales bacterium]|nr:two pore domain potassium channel family protein [Pseudomonadales bacterium]